VQQAVVKRADVGAVSLPETALPLGHDHGSGKTSHAFALFVCCPSALRLILPNKAQKFNRLIPPQPKLWFDYRH
jgi:hypothetical protein